MQPTSLSDARRAGSQRIPCAVQAFNLLLLTWSTRLYKRYVLWYFRMGHSWLETSIMRRRLPQAFDEGIRWRWYLASTSFPVPPVESGTMDSVACLERQWTVAHRKSSNFKNVRKLRTSKIAWDGTNDKLSPITMMMYIEWKTVLEAINKYDDERNQTKFMYSP
jgi:hypothetical protein